MNHGRPTCCPRRMWWARGERARGMGMGRGAVSRRVERGSGMGASCRSPARRRAQAWGTSPRVGTCTGYCSMSWRRQLHGGGISYGGRCSGGLFLVVFLLRVPVPHDLLVPTAAVADVVILQNRYSRTTSFSVPAKMPANQQLHQLGITLPATPHCAQWTTRAQGRRRHCDTPPRT
jgi:hypothetical protein